MGRTRMLWRAHVMRFEEIVGRLDTGRLSCEEAAQVLGMSVSSSHA